MNALKQLVLTSIIGLSLLPGKVFAHGTEEQQNGLTTSTYVFFASVLLFILFFALYTIVKNKVKGLNNAKKQEAREQRLRLTKKLQLLKWGWIASILGVVITGSLSFLGKDGAEVYLEHVHGLGYSTDGKRILIPAHDGLKAYSDGHWLTPEGEKHDYMGFSTVDDGFYSSGHPAPGSDKKNPFGIVKSADEGKSFKTLDLYGQIDFHNMAVGFKSHAIYVINPEPNARMSSTGLYYSLDDAKTWTKSGMNGVNEEPTALTVHPTDPAVVALGTQTGVYLSKDKGQTFKKVLSRGQTTSLFFNDQGTLFIGGYSNQAYLLKLNLDTKKTDEVKLPVLTEDAVAYFAQNPVEENEMSFATFNKDVYTSNDKGLNWEKLADQGNAISSENH